MIKQSILWDIVSGLRLVFLVVLGEGSVSWIKNDYKNITIPKLNQNLKFKYIGVKKIMSN
jgi:hypothetical protein